jgi:hypothetical protein
MTEQGEALCTGTTELDRRSPSKTQPSSSGTHLSSEPSYLGPVGDITYESLLGRLTMSRQEPAPLTPLPRHRVSMWSSNLHRPA